MLPQNDVLTYRQKSAELNGIIAGIQPIYDILSKADLKTRLPRPFQHGADR